MEEDHQELQLLPSPHTTNLPPSSSSPSKPSTTTWAASDSTIKLQSMKNLNPFVEGPSLDLQLSISFRTIKNNRPKTKDHFINTNSKSNKNDTSNNMMMVTMDGSVEALKWQAAEQIRLAAMEKAYAERVRELSRREMEMAQTEFARARSMWEKAREEVEKAEKLKERATRISSMEDASTSTIFGGMA
ncbi:OLC1v1013660C1 [Oldenlandia corymbosa var. corymbosa]|uniref:OLC1v1013660C1 n=1 Tax=Oldenlandia corymbosa var. corymbosa TaxID=529605 RepID=A0AAV1E0X7_OLDCO|nr:OLC1v1013660C1 [Oldenlandia corymbosa var. corymbosa]